MSARPLRVVLATRNDHKVREFGRMLPGVSVEALPASVELPPETGETFEVNALVKARAAAVATGTAAIADDSGIEAFALGGEPGVRSARYAGEQATDAENLALLRARAPVGSGLAYVCALVYVDPQANIEHVITRRCTGTLAAEERGDGGFGYDPVFLPDGDHGGRTMAELSDAEKDAISHRGRAARALLRWLTEPGA